MPVLRKAHVIQHGGMQRVNELDSDMAAFPPADPRLDRPDRTDADGEIGIDDKVREPVEEFAAVMGKIRDFHITRHTVSSAIAPLDLQFVPKFVSAVHSKKPMLSRRQDGWPSQSV